MIYRSENGARALLAVRCYGVVQSDGDLLVRRLTLQPLEWQMDRGCTNPLEINIPNAYRCRPNFANRIPIGGARRASRGFSKRPLLQISNI